jgi:hypothetical protein
LVVGAGVPHGVTAFEIVLEERPSKARRTLHAIIRGDLSIRRQPDDAASVVGAVGIRDADVPLADTGMFVTLLLHDKRGNLLEVLPGSPASESGATFFRIRFDSFLPLGRRVKESRIFVEVAGLEEAPGAAKPPGVRAP